MKINKNEKYHYFHPKNRRQYQDMINFMLGNKFIIPHIVFVSLPFNFDFARYERIKRYTISNRNDSKEMIEELVKIANYHYCIKGEK